MFRWDRFVGLFLATTHTLLFSQLNLQHHYDIGREIQTSTAEFFFIDNLGATFGFVDINYDNQHFNKKGATDIWFEVARYFSIGSFIQTPLLNKSLSITVQYNDGIYFYLSESNSMESTLYPILLAGISYPIKIGDLVLPTDLLLRKQHGDKGLTFQLTTVWYHPLSKKFATAGFLDIWTNDGSNVISIMAEPQLMVHFNKWDVGIEIEISRGFPGAWMKGEDYSDDKKIWAIPTIFIKYTFN